MLLVAFAAQGPGMQQWQAAAAAPLRAAGASLDALYLADPSNSYYLQAPPPPFVRLSSRVHPIFSSPSSSSSSRPRPASTPSQDPSGGWRGLDHYSSLILSHSRLYNHVLVVGSSMGGTAAGWKCLSSLSDDGAPPASLDLLKGSGRAYAPRSTG